MKSASAAGIQAAAGNERQVAARGGVEAGRHALVEDQVEQRLEGAAPLRRRLAQGPAQRGGPGDIAANRLARQRVDEVDAAGRHPSGLNPHLGGGRFHGHAASLVAGTGAPNRAALRPPAGPHRLTAGAPKYHDIDRMEVEVRANPDSRDLRGRLLFAYAEDDRTLTDPRRLVHIKWFIERHPEDDICRSPLAQPDPQRQPVA